MRSQAMTATARCASGIVGIGRERLVEKRDRFGVVQVVGGVERLRRSSSATAGCARA